MKSSGVVRKVLAAPMDGPSVGLVSDDEVSAARGGGSVAASDDGRLPGVASADVSVRGAASPLRSRSDPLAPAVTAGVTESGKGLGGVGKGLLVVILEAAASVWVDTGKRV